MAARVPRAAPSARDGIVAVALLADPRMWSSLFEVLSEVTIKLGHPHRGVLLAGAAAALRDAYQDGAPPALVDVDDPLELARASLTEAEITELYERGRALSYEEAVALARKGLDNA